jgi:hypothetical protein
VFQKNLKKKDFKIRTDYITSLYKDLKEWEEKVENNEYKEIEKKHNKYFTRKEQARQMKTKSNLYKDLNSIMNKSVLFEEV